MSFSAFELTLSTTAMKFSIASMYTNFTSTIVDAEGIEQAEGFTAGPKGNKLVLQFQRA